MATGKVELAQITKNNNKATVTVIFEFRGRNRTKEYELALPDYNIHDPDHAIFSLAMEKAITDLNNIDFDEEND